MRKIWMCITLCLLILLAACSGKGTDAGGGDASLNEHSPEDKKTVAIAVMYEDPYLVEAVRRFEEIHEDIRIEIHAHQVLVGNGVVLAMSQADMDKFVQTVTTQALAGNASDLIAMNNLPQDKFIKRNILLDLNELIANDPSFDKSQYYLNILETSRSGDGLYSIPINFYLDNVVKADRSLLDAANITIDDSTWTWDEFKAIAAKLQEHTAGDLTVFANLPPGLMLLQYINANYAELAGEGEANFDTDSFRHVLQQIKSLYDEGILDPEYSMDPGESVFVLNGLVEPFSAWADLMQPDTEFLQMPSFDGNATGFGYGVSLMFGINSKSQVKEEAWEFIKFMLSDEMQSAPELGGYPLNKNVLADRLESSRQAFEQDGAPLPGGLPSEETMEETIHILNDMLENMKTMAKADMKVITIASEEFASFISGQKSAEEVSGLIQNRVETYLNE